MSLEDFEKAADKLPYYFSPSVPFEFDGDEIWEPKPTSPIPLLNPKEYVSTGINVAGVEQTSSGKVTAIITDSGVKIPIVDYSSSGFRDTQELISGCHMHPLDLVPNALKDAISEKITDDISSKPPPDFLTKCLNTRNLPVYKPSSREEIKKALNSYYGQKNVSKYPKIEYISCNPEPSYSIGKLAREYADQLDAYRYAVGYLDKWEGEGRICKADAKGRDAPILIVDEFSKNDCTKAHDYLQRFIRKICEENGAPELVDFLSITFRYDYVSVLNENIQYRIELNYQDLQQNGYHYTDKVLIGFDDRVHGFSQDELELLNAKIEKMIQRYINDRLQYSLWERSSKYFSLRDTFSARIFCMIKRICKQENVPELIDSFAIELDDEKEALSNLFSQWIIELDYTSKDQSFRFNDNFRIVMAKEDYHLTYQEEDYIRHEVLRIIKAYLEETNNIDISKGENEMAKTEAQIRYEEKCNEAKKAYDEALRVARVELDVAEQKKTCDNAANMMRDLYDSYITAGFSEEQAMKFVTIALEKGK